MRVSSNNNVLSISLESKTWFVFLGKDNAINSFTAAEAQFAHPCYKWEYFSHDSL